MHFLDHVDDPLEPLLQAQVRQPACLLNSYFPPQVAIPGQSQLISNFRVSQGALHILFVRKDQNWDFRVCCFSHDLVQGVAHVAQCILVRRVDHENYAIDTLIVVLPSVSEFELA